MKQSFLDAGEPVISIDTKKKELIGNFKNAGRAWRTDPEEVNAHDFPSDAECRAAPYGVYDLANNRGFVTVGTSADTPELAVDRLARWWRQDGTRLIALQQLQAFVERGGQPQRLHESVNRTNPSRIRCAGPVGHFVLGTPPADDRMIR